MSKKLAAISFPIHFIGMPRPKPKYQIPRRKRGSGFGILIFLILAAGGIYFFWQHEHSKKIILPKMIFKLLARQFTVSRQSPADFPRPVLDVFEAQVALARRGISSGSIDAAIGSQTREAISVFQQQQ